MNIKEACKKWLLDHDFIERKPYFKDDVESLYNMVLNIINGLSTVKYDPAYGDDRRCFKCSHTYYRHFDCFENMEQAGCKYCGCDEFIGVDET